MPPSDESAKRTESVLYTHHRLDRGYVVLWNETRLLIIGYSTTLNHGHWDTPFDRRTGDRLEQDIDDAIAAYVSRGGQPRPPSPSRSDQ